MVETETTEETSETKGETQDTTATAKLRDLRTEKDPMGGKRDASRTTGPLNSQKAAS